MTRHRWRHLRVNMAPLTAEDPLCQSWVKHLSSLTVRGQDKQCVLLWSCSKEWFVTRHSSTVREQFHVPTGWCTISQIKTHGGFLACKCPSLHWAAKLAIELTWSESGGLFDLGRSSAAGNISSEDWWRWSSEASPEQMLEYAQPRINQRCYWPVV